MGLDMYLHAELYTSKWFEEDMHTKLEAVGIDWPRQDKPVSISVTTTVLYWRKANHIHKWFVENCQDGEDECREHGVSIEQLTELRDLCATLLKNRDPQEARTQLPPSNGFFFGSTDIDDGYWQDIEHTLEGLNQILSHPNATRFDYSYRSSW